LKFQGNFHDVLSDDRDPIAVVGCGFESSAAAQVVQWHLVAMFSPSLILKLIDIDRHLWRIVTLGCLLLASLLMILSGEQLINFNLGGIGHRRWKSWLLPVS